MADIPYTEAVKAKRAATNGGRGSFSYADTSIFGERQQKQGLNGGGGGGARPKNLRYGSHAVSFIPKGAVIIRLTRVG